jgi:DNA-directed RNA polymerase specialized sigma24 family protein
MPFTAHDLRYDLERTYPSLCAYLQHRAQRYLGPLAYDAYEVDQVVGHVVEQLTRLQLLGAGDHAPQTALDRLSNAQFYAFLNQSVKHKAIDRLRKRRLPISTLAELEGPGNSEEENDPLNTVTNSIWGSTPFPTPEAAAVEAASQQELRILLKHCIEALSAAPRQLQAILQELEEVGAGDLLRELREEYQALLANLQLSHLSQHKDHAHKKLRHCLQKSSSNLAVTVALRLTEYGVYSAGTDEALVDIKTLAQDDLSEREVQTGLKHLVTTGLLEWHGEEFVRFSSVQHKHLARFYEEGE